MDGLDLFKREFGIMEQIPYLSFTNIGFLLCSYLVIIFHSLLGCLFSTFSMNCSCVIAFFVATPIFIYFNVRPHRTYQTEFLRPYLFSTPVSYSLAQLPT